jgi:hypothetical protein
MDCLIIDEISMFSLKMIEQVQHVLCKIHSILFFLGFFYAFHYMQIKPLLMPHGKITGVPNKQGLVFCTDKKYTSIKVCNKDERGTKRTYYQIFLQNSFHIIFLRFFLCIPLHANQAFVNAHLY